MKSMVNVHAAKTNFSKLLARVAQGEEIVIAKDGTPIAKLVGINAASAPRPLGLFAGQMWVADNAFETPEWLADAFEGIGGDQPFPAVKSPARKIAEPNARKQAKGKTRA